MTYWNVLRTARASIAGLCRRTWVVVLVLSLLFQSAFVAGHQVAMAAGTEICTAEGSRWISTDADDPHGKRDMHDCCCTATPAAPPTTFVQPDWRVADTLTSTFVAAGTLAAQWLAPQSRGPPSSP